MIGPSRNTWLDGAVKLPELPDCYRTSQCSTEPLQTLYCDKSHLIFAGAVILSTAKLNLKVPTFSAVN